MLFTLIEKGLSGVRSAAIKQVERLQLDNIRLVDKDQELEAKVEREVLALQQRIEELQDQGFAKGCELDDRRRANVSRIRRCNKIVKAIDSVTNEEVSA